MPPPPQGAGPAFPLCPRCESLGPCVPVSQPGTQPKLTKGKRAHHHRPSPPPDLRHGRTYLILGQAFKAIVHNIHRVALGDAGTHRRAHGRVHASRRGPHVQDGQGEVGLQRRGRDKRVSTGLGGPLTQMEVSRQQFPGKGPRSSGQPGHCPGTGLPWT